MTIRMRMSSTIRTSGETSQSRHRHTVRSGGALAGAGDSSTSADGEEVESDLLCLCRDSLLWRASICEDKATRQQFMYLFLEGL